ncbi:MAG TPA: M23 family metallopeptidase [Gemmatimonadales bacterium]|nr:M23 family metallopeptidase [Gemmatimonadales bacterium]
MRRVRFALASGILAAAALFALSGRWPWRRLEVYAPPVAAAPSPREHSDTLRAGETLTDLLGRQGLGGAELAAIFERAGLDPRRLRSGLVVQFRHQAQEPSPSEISIRTGADERVAARLSSGSWSAERRPVAWRSEVVRIEGPIDNSLYEALDARIPDELFDAGNRVRLAWDLADVYAWSVDFNRDIQPGDRFNVLVEREVSEEGEVRSGAILAADLLTSGKHLSAYRFAVPAGPARYYDAEGNSLRRAFLRAPVEFRRIASNFSRARLHPILGIWRRHEGTDYSAARGTPVLAAGNGIVLRAGWGGGYGNLVELRHLNGITTRYGHLSGFARGIRPGSRVDQGQVVGYVGSSGLASGPHLHYEFRVDGVARDSRRVELGHGEALPAAYRQLFLAERTRLVAALGGGAVALGDQ